LPQKAVDGLLRCNLIMPVTRQHEAFAIGLVQIFPSAIADANALPAWNRARRHGITGRPAARRYDARQKRIQGITRRQRQKGPNPLQLLNRNDLQGAFRNCQLLNGHSAREKERGVNGAFRRRVVRSRPSREVLETGWRQIVTELFLDFAHDTFEKALIALASATKQSDLPRASSPQS
jgi:hypothetical protein